MTRGRGFGGLGGDRMRSAADKAKSMARDVSRRTAPGRRWVKVKAVRSRGWLKSHPGGAAAMVAGVLGLLSLSAGLLLGSWASVCRDCPSVAAIYSWEPKSATQILDHDGKLIAQLATEKRTPVKLETLPAHVPHAFVAIEDKRFYRHEGFDVRSLIGVNVRRLMQFRRPAGASTITQQLARHMFSTEVGFKPGDRRPSRKMKELKVAFQLEDVYSKEQILEAYINQVNYGEGHYGIESASQFFFGKPAIELNVAEAAMLAAVVNLPEFYSPFKNPERARGRRNIVLSYMADQGYLTREEAAKWKAEPLPETPHRSRDSDIAPYFVEWVRTILNQRFGSDNVYVKGYRVTTSLDLEIQQAAQMSIDSGWAVIEKAQGKRAPTFASVKAEGGTRNATETAYLQGMALAIDPKTGDVRAMIGGRDFDDSKFNRAVQALRQPGSTFKPILFTAAIGAGIPASHVINDSPVMLELVDGTIYSPKNYDPDFRGELTLRDALKFSVNTVAVKLGVEVGLETVSQTARQMGIRTPVRPYFATSIGAESVYPIQLAEAYTVLANNGMRVHPRFIVKVESADGVVLWEPPIENEQVIDPAVAAIVRDMMRTALDHGSGYPARNPSWGRGLPYDVPAAGKTGTTNDATDIWFAGFTPDLLAVFWYGYDRPRKIPVANAAGGVWVAPVWGNFMHQLYYGEQPEFEKPGQWPIPDGITYRLVDKKTGMLASSFCPPEDAYQEMFITGTEPTELCRNIDEGLFGGFRRRGRIGTDTMTMDTTGLPRRRRIMETPDHGTPRQR